MKLSKIKELLSTIETVSFRLENKQLVPPNFHVTEIGIIVKKFIDCGGIVRSENVINFQLWHAEDFDHRLKPKRLLDIISLAETTLVLTDQEIEVEYQSETIGKYDLGFNGTDFLLLNKKTTCLAIDQCGISITENIILNKNSQNNCVPGSGCC
ncbi:MAG: hypothetical protein RLZZ312_189 [Bacteroidota bacterium]|jgi:hypothetical protein